MSYNTLLNRRLSKIDSRHHYMYRLNHYNSMCQIHNYDMNMKREFIFNNKSRSADISFSKFLDKVNEKYKDIFEALDNE